MRDAFQEIVQGWALISGMEDITDRIERAAEWTKAHGPLQPAEQATIELMIECQVARGMGWNSDICPECDGIGDAHQDWCDELVDTVTVEEGN